MVVNVSRGGGGVGQANGTNWINGLEISAGQHEIRIENSSCGHMTSSTTVECLQGVVPDVDLLTFEGLLCG